MGPSGGRYLLIGPPSALVVRHQLALALETDPDRVDPALEAVVMRFCATSPFWLGEILAFIVMYGLEEFLADMTGNRRHPEEEGQMMAIGRITSMTSVKLTRTLSGHAPRKLSAAKAAATAAMINDSNTASDSYDKQSSTIRFSTYLPMLMRRLSLTNYPPVMAPSPLVGKQQQQQQPEAAAVGGKAGGAAGGGRGSTSIAIPAADGQPSHPHPSITNAALGRMERRNTSYHAATATATSIPFQTNQTLNNSGDLALSTRQQQLSNQSLLMNGSSTAGPRPGMLAGASTSAGASAGGSNSRSRSGASFTNRSISQISNQSFHAVGTRMSVLSAHLVNGMTHGALAVTDQGGFKVVTAGLPLSPISPLSPLSTLTFD